MLRTKVGRGVLTHSVNHTKEGLGSALHFNRTPANNVCEDCEMRLHVTRYIRNVQTRLDNVMEGG